MRPEKRAAKIGGLTMPTENQDFVFCKSYRHKSGKIIVHPTGYFKFPRTRPLKEEKVLSVIKNRMILITQTQYRKQG